jgi:putative hemolysin
MMHIELLLLLGLILLNGFFALSEMAIVTSRKSRLKQEAESSRTAAAALKLAEQPENFLSAVQIGITLVGILMGVFGGEAIGERIAAQIAGVDWLGPYAHSVGLGLAVLLITVFTIVLGELIPKRLALVAPERIAVVVGVPMRVFSHLAYPLVLMLSVLTRGCLRLLRVPTDQKSRITEEEIRLFVAESAEQGEIEDIERNLINRALRLADRTAESLMTPRNRIVWLDVNATLDENLARLAAAPYSSFPVYRGSDQDVLGVLKVKSLVSQIGRGESIDLFARLDKALYVPETTRAPALLEEFRKANSNLALVVDEYGDIVGLVTRSDVVSAVLGAAAQPAGERDEEAMIVRRPDGSFLLDGTLKIEDLRELLSLRSLPGEGELEYQTLAGMLIAVLGHIPKVAERYDWEGWRFEVMDIDGARVDRVLASRVGE